MVVNQFQDLNPSQQQYLHQIGFQKCVQLLGRTSDEFILVIEPRSRGTKRLFSETFTETICETQKKKRHLNTESKNSTKMELN
jgi:hypothetical protein